MGEYFDFKKSFAEGIIKLHEIFSIFAIFDENLSRPVRIVLYFIKLTGLMAISAAFSQALNQVQSILLSVISGVFIAIPIAIVQKFY